MTLFIGAPAAALLALTTALLASCRSSTVTPLRDGDAVLFPRVSGTNLLDEKITFPDDLIGRPALILVAFKQRQQFDVNTWLDRIPDIEAAVPGITIIETPTISAFPWGAVAGWVDDGMRSGILTREARERTVTLFTDPAAFRRALGLPSPDRIYAVALDADARVLRVTEGPLTNDSLEILLDAYPTRVPQTPGE